jgi:hypothetical protein
MEPTENMIRMLRRRAREYESRASGPVTREVRDVLLMMAHSYESEAARLAGEPRKNQDAA